MQVAFYVKHIMFTGIIETRLLYADPKIQAQCYLGASHVLVYLGLYSMVWSFNNARPR